MKTSPAFIAITVAVLVAVVVHLLLTGRKWEQKRLRPLAGLAFGFVLAGILFGEDRAFGYGFLGFGVILAIVDIVIRARGK